MNKIYLFLAIISLSFLTNCGEDILGEEELIETSTQDPIFTKSSKVVGIVVNENNFPMPNVKVTYSRIDYTTDQNGVFKIDNIKASTEGGILFFNKENYFQNFKFFYPDIEANEYLEVQMIEMKDADVVSGMTGGEVSLEDGLKISFPSNAFISTNGVSYEGEVEVYTHWFDPTSDNLAISMPGDLRGLNSEEQLVQLATYGMVAVELRSSNGQELQLAENKKATITLPIPELLNNFAPETIPSWSLNEESVYWEEEALAQKIENTYEFEVSHFSFWNCDVPYPLVNLTGKLVDQDNKPLPYYSICITAFNNTLTGYGWTNSSGIFNGKIPKGEDLLLLVKDDCGNIVLERELPPFETDATLGEIRIDNAKTLVISGRLFCTGVPVSDGYAIAFFEEQATTISEVDANGNFEIVLLECFEGELNIQGIDRQNLNTSDFIQITTNNQSSPIDLGIIQTCEELDEYIIFKSNDSQEKLYTNPSANFTTGLINNSPSRLVNISMRSGNDFIYISSIDPEEGVTLQASDANFGQQDEINNTYSSGACSPDDDCLNITFTMLSEMEGEYIEGSFMGSLPDSLSVTIPLMGSFRIRLDEAVNNSFVNGNVWLDENADGLRQNNEAGIPNIRISRNPGQINAITDAEGNYQITVPTGVEFELSANANSNFSTLPNVGSDETINSDYNEDFIYNGFTNELVLNNIDLGLIPGQIACTIDSVENIGCLGDSGLFHLTISGGTQPYSYEIFLNGNPIDSNVPNPANIVYFDNITEAGEYLVIVTDAEENICESEIIIEETTQVFCEISSTDASCSVSNGTATVTSSGGAGGYTYNWSNGATTSVITGLAAGTYTVTVIDALGCSTTCSVNLSGSEAITCIASSTAATCSSSNGTASVEVINGSGDYSYSWSNGGTSQSITGLIGGTYTVNITDNLTGCTTSCNVTIEETNGITCNIVPSPATCGEANGAATVEVIDGSGDYSYSWNNSATSQSISDLAEGIYEVQVVDNITGCVTFCEVEIQVIPEVFFAINSEEIFCNPQSGQTSAIVSIEIQGGQGPYEVNWGDNSPTIFIDDINFIESHNYLEADNYFITVQDESGCIYSEIINVEIPFISPTISGIVWIENPNGINNLLDTFDIRSEGILVNLYEPGNLQDPLLTTTTNSEGEYIFLDIDNDAEYIVQFVIDEEEYNFVEKQVGTNAIINSKINPDTGYSDAFQTIGCYGYDNLNAGLREK